MQHSPTLRQTCVRDTLNCLALATVASLAISLGLHLRPTYVMGYIGTILTATALAQGVLSWIAQFCGDADAARGAVLGGISTIVTAGVLMTASALT